jgi:hypothetical protein
MIKELVAHVYYNKRLKKYNVITNEGDNVTSDININKIKYAYRTKGGLRGIVEASGKIKWRTAKLKHLKIRYETNEEIQERIQREENKVKTIWYNKLANNNLKNKK